jgi:hypothetical protein
MEVSRFRDSMNRKKDRAPTNIADSICNGFVGALGELTVSMLIGIKWTGATLEETEWQQWRKINADLGPFEVKTVSSEGGTLNLGDGDKDWAIGVLALAPEARSLAPILYSGKEIKNPITVKIIGYLPVDVGKQIGYKSEVRYESGYVKVNYAVAQKKLRPLSDLGPLVKSLQTKRGKTISHIKNVPPFVMENYESLRSY